MQLSLLGEKAEGLEVCCHIGAGLCTSSNSMWTEIYMISTIRYASSRSLSGVIAQWTYWSIIIFRFPYDVQDQKKATSVYCRCDICSPIEL